MKKYIRSIIYAMAPALMVLVTACDDTGEFLEINTDPSNPTTAELNQILPTVGLDVGGALGTQTGGLGGGIMGDYMHYTVERGSNENFYAINPDNFRIITPWRTFYTRALQDIESMINQATEEEAFHYVGVGQILRSFIFSIMVDTWGMVPYTQANQGAEFVNPAYDNGQMIYDDIQNNVLDQAIANLSGASTLSPGADDLFYGGDLNKWIRLANTLKLKMLNQVRLVQNVSGEVNSLLGSGNLIGPGDDFEFHYGTGSNPDNRNPGYTQEYAPGGQFYYPSPFLFEMMRGIDTFGHGNDLLSGIIDPRGPYYWYNQLGFGATDDQAENPCSYCPSRTGTGFLSIWMFSFNIDPNEGFDQASSQSVLGLYPLGGRFDDGVGGVTNFNGVASTPQRYLTYYDLKFIEAELAITGASNGDARTAFQTGVEAALNKVDEYAVQGGAPAIDDNTGSPYLTNSSTRTKAAYVAEIMARYDAADDAGKLEHIMTQKWLANYGKAWDAYTDFRRTGFPRLHDGNADNLTTTVRGRSFPVSMPYSSEDVNANSNAPPQRRIALDRVFWDPN